MEWIKLTDRCPNPDEHGRVLIYTEGHDFNGEQVFDVRAETLNECFYANPDDQPEVCKHATHWAQHPRGAGSGFLREGYLVRRPEECALTVEAEANQNPSKGQ